MTWQNKDQLIGSHKKQIYAPLTNEIYSQVSTLDYDLINAVLSCYNDVNKEIALFPQPDEHQEDEY